MYHWQTHVDTLLTVHSKKKKQQPTNTWLTKRMAKMITEMTQTNKWPWPL